MKNFRKLVTTLAVGMIGTLGLSACGTTIQIDADSLEEMDDITLTVADIDPEGSVHNLALRTFMDEVTEQTGGKISFEAYTSAALMPGDEMLSGIGRGTADMGRLVTFYFPQELPAGNWFLDLAASQSNSYPHGLIQSAMAGHQAHVGEGPIRAELEEYNVVPLVSYPTAQQYDMLCTRPVETVGDTQGLRVRTGGELHVNEAEALGMIPVPLPVTEMYEGLQRGVVDCITLQVPGHIDYGLWEVAPHYVPLSMSPLNAMPFVINKDLWEALPEDAQQIMRDSAVTALTETLANIIENYEQFATEGPEQHSTIFNDPRELDRVLAEYQQGREDAMTNNIPEGVSDPDRVIDGVLSSHEEWLDYLQNELNLPETERDPESIEDSFRETGEVDLQPLWDRIQETEFTTN